MWLQAQVGQVKQGGLKWRGTPFETVLEVNEKMPGPND
jgi:hypothetical protein